MARAFVVPQPLVVQPIDLDALGAGVAHPGRASPAAAGGSWVTLAAGGRGPRSASRPLPPGRHSLVRRRGVWDVAANDDQRQTWTRSAAAAVPLMCCWIARETQEPRRPPGLACGALPAWRVAGRRGGWVSGGWRASPCSEPMPCRGQPVYRARQPRAARHAQARTTAAEGAGVPADGPAASCIRSEAANTPQIHHFSRSTSSTYSRVLLPKRSRSCSGGAGTRRWTPNLAVAGATTRMPSWCAAPWPLVRRPLLQRQPQPPPGPSAPPPPSPAARSSAPPRCARRLKRCRWWSPGPSGRAWRFKRRVEKKPVSRISLLGQQLPPAARPAARAGAGAARPYGSKFGGTRSRQAQPTLRAAAGGAPDGCLHHAVLALLLREPAGHRGDRRAWQRCIV